MTFLRFTTYSVILQRFTDFSVIFGCAFQEGGRKIQHQSFAPDFAIASGCNEPLGIQHFDKTMGENSRLPCTSFCNDSNVVCFVDSGIYSWKESRETSSTRISEGNEVGVRMPKSCNSPLFSAVLCMAGLIASSIKIEIRVSQCKSPLYRSDSNEVGAKYL